MARILHDLAATGGGRDIRFSPYCWRTKLALAHKRLDYETRACRFSDIDALSGGGDRLTLPTLDDGADRVTDSWAIAEHLEAAYPDSPSLFPTGREVARLANAWAFNALHPALLKVILLDVFNTLDEEDRIYFRQSREARFGRPLESVVADREAGLAGFRAALQPIRDVLAAAPFLAGPAPAYADYVPAGVFLWAEAVGADGLLEPGDPVAAWLRRVTAVLAGAD